MVGLPVSAGWAQLTNPSFEDDLNGWDVFDGTVGTDVDVYTQGELGPLGPNPNAPDGTKYAGIIKDRTTTTNEVSIWQEYAVQNHTPGSIVNFSVELDVACWANDIGGDPNSQIEVTIGWENDGIWEPGDDPASPRRICDVHRNSHKATGNDDSDDPFRHVKITGTLPDDPQEIILRIKFRHNGHNSQSNMTVVDNVIFYAACGDPPAPPATNLLTNGDFETPPYNVTYDPYNDPVVVPAGWTHGGSGQYDDGPGEGFTNGMTSPTDPLGVSTTDGTHFYGVAKPNDSGSQPKITIFQIVPVTNYHPCATGLRFKLHYMSNNSVDPEPSWWDHAGTEIWLRWMADGSEPTGIAQTYPWIASLWSHVRYTDNEQANMTVIDTSSEIDTVDQDGDPLAVEYVVFSIHFNTWRPPSTGYEYRALADDFRFEVEAIIPDDVRILDESPLPDADCEVFYEHQLTGCYVEPLTWSLVSGILPPGLELSPSGLISGLATSGATYAFTLQLQDGNLATTTKDFELTATGNCCGSIPPDFDRDGDVDQGDFSFLQMCLTGAGGGVPLPPDNPDCSCADLDRDGLDVDQMDIVVFELCASGPGISAIEGCDKEACCFDDGSCQILHPADCASQGGTSQGVGTDCDPNPCPQPGACCLDDFPDNTCAEMFEDECAAAGGSWRGVGTDCETAGCTTVNEACCWANGSCYEYPPSYCLGYGATPMGAGTTCTPNPCP